MAQEYWNAALKAEKLPYGFFVMRPEAAMTHAGLPRIIRELNIWKMAAALQIDMVVAIKSGVLTRDNPLDLLHSMTRRCAACDKTEECGRALRALISPAKGPPEFCCVKNRLSELAIQQRPGHSQAS